MSFRFKTIIGIALIESVLLVTLILSVLGFLENSHEKEINQRALSTAKLFATMSKDAVLASDLASLESFVNEILTNEDIVYARIYGDGIILAEGGSKEHLEHTHDKNNTSLDQAIDDVFDVTANIAESDYIYGRVELGLSIARIREVLDQASHWSIVIASIEITLVAVFSFILGTWLTRQLYQLKKATEIITEHGPGHQVEIKGRDEMAQVAKSFNQMSISLSDSYKELKNINIANKKIAEMASESEAFVKAVLSSSLDAIVSIDTQGMIVEYNHVSEQIFGYTREEAIGSSMAELIIPEEYRTMHREGFESYLKTGVATILNKRLSVKAINKQGCIFPIELTISPIETGKKLYFTAFIRDISEQENAKNELLLSARAFEAHEAIFISDSHNKIVRVNNAFTKITGYSANEIIGQSPGVLSSGRHDSQFYNEMWQRIKQTGHWEGEIYNKRKDGEIYPEWLSISVVRDINGNESYYVAHFIDITQRKQAEQKLTLARKEAELANEAKSDFLATMSHEIRTPMNAILGTLGLLKETMLDQEQKKYIETADQSAVSLLHIINEILDFSKIEANKLVIEKSTFSIEDMLSDCRKMFSDKAIDHKNKLNCHIDPDVPCYLISDKLRIKQILINLINNALKFTEQGEVNCVIKKIKQVEQQIQLKFEVIDNGIGISKAQQKKLFQVFSQVDQKHNRQFEGTGLGLAICKKLVNLLAGEIGVNTETGVGSQFWFTLTVDIDPQQHPEKKALKIKQKNTSFKPLNILLSEDSLANIVVAKAVLTKAGHTLEIAKDGRQAIAAVKRSVENNHIFDLILMDLMMPIMDGIEATRIIRKMPGGISKIAIIAMTANAVKGDREYCLQAGMDDYISKPFVAAELLQKIEDVSNFKPALHITKKTVVDESMRVPENNELIRQLNELPYMHDKVLKQLAEDISVELVPEMVAVFIKELKKRLAKIEQACEQKNVKDIAFEVHALKSSSGTYGALKLQLMSKMTDTACKEKNQLQVLLLSDSLLKLIPETIALYSKKFPT
ncbi:MAG: PAS domain S-box protein [Thiohalomonas sp.]|nr:PAS domain S-box protein [Thiohalomonas sp.]